MDDSIVIRLAEMADIPRLLEVGNHLFDNPIDEDRAKEFFLDDRHYLVIALKEEKVIGMASGFLYVHPDKDPSMFIMEVGVADEYQNQGIGREVVKTLVHRARLLGARESWIATEESNIAARKAYQAAGGREAKERAIVYDFK